MVNAYHVLSSEHLRKTAYFFNIPHLVNSYATVKTTQRRFPNMFFLAVQKKNHKKVLKTQIVLQLI